MKQRPLIAGAVILLFSGAVMITHVALSDANENPQTICPGFQLMEEIIGLNAVLAEKSIETAAKQSTIESRVRMRCGYSSWLNETSHVRQNMCAQLKTSFRFLSVLQKHCAGKFTAPSPDWESLAAKISKIQKRIIDNLPYGCSVEMDSE